MSQRLDIPEPRCFLRPIVLRTYYLCGPCQFRSQGQFLLPNQMERVCSEGLVMVAIFILVTPQREPPAIFALP